MPIPVPAAVEAALSCSRGWDDFSRNVYCALGLPIDAIDMPGLLAVVDQAVANHTPFLISTPNLSFFMNSRTDAAFRDSVLLSEICPPDGMPVVWVARLLGLPIRQRVAGADLFEMLKARPPNRQLKLFLFGGADGVAQAAGTALNKVPNGLSCVGSAYPGFGTVEDMSRDGTIAKINDSHADFLVVALGAQKGQSWLVSNHERLTIPIRSHLGASINFAAGTIRRAPAFFRRSGLEWIWRIKEEPHLWRRYWRDGCKFLGILVTHVIPVAAFERCAHCYERLFPRFAIERIADHQTTTLIFRGTATRRNADAAGTILREAAAAHKAIRVDLAHASIIDARFLGLLLMLSKQAKKQSAKLTFVGASGALRAIFRLHGAGYLLEVE